MAISTADIDSQDVIGRTPLLWAVLIVNDEAVESLLKFEANVNLSDIIGLTPLIAAAYINLVLYIDKLVFVGADLHAVDRNGNSALWYAHHFKKKKKAVARLMSHESKLENKSELFFELADEYGYGTRVIEELTDGSSDGGSVGESDVEDMEELTDGSSDSGSVGESDVEDMEESDLNDTGDLDEASGAEDIVEDLDAENGDDFADALETLSIQQT